MQVLDIYKIDIVDFVSPTFKKHFQVHKTSTLLAVKELNYKLTFTQLFAVFIQKYIYSLKKVQI